MSNMKTNLKFVMGTNRLNKLLASKNMNTSGCEFVSTINISTNSKIKDKHSLRKMTESKPTRNETRPLQSINPSTESTSLNKRNKFIEKLTDLETNKISNNPNSENEVYDLNLKSNQSPKINLKDLRNFQRDSQTKDINIYNSNNSNRSNKNSNREEKKNSKHLKNLSEIPPSFRNIPAFTEHNRDKNRDRENFEKSNLDPSIVKTKSQKVFVNKEKPKDKLPITKSPVKKEKRDLSVNSYIKQVKISAKDNIPSEDSNNYFNEKLENDNKLQELNNKCLQQDKTIKDLLLTAEILKNYIKSFENFGGSIKSKLNMRLQEKDFEIMKLQVRN